MEIVGYILGGLNAIFVIIVAINRKIDDILLEARSMIKEEFKLAYHEFANTSAAGATNLERLDMSVNRLKRLHCASISDLLKIKSIEWCCNHIISFAIIAIIIITISISVGHFAIDESNNTLQILLIIVIPFILFVVNLVILGTILKNEGYLKRVIDRYKKLEY